MRAVRFPLISRLILTPMELNPAFKKLFVPTLVLLAFFGLQKQGILFQDLISPGLPFLFLGLISVLIGALLVPLLLPYTPFRSFALKGLLLSAVLYALGFPLISHALNHNPWLLAAAYLLFPALSSYLALNFTGATTFTNISGVKKELRITIPIYITVAALSGVLIIIYKLTTWGIL
jgi:phosphoglycerol transferase MdoB-like AlkP superfamily enzyme